ncbi:hypothetical protein Golob_026285 [Gossypium lobatum]|uniref:CCHC-type domain-containing protein n=1 Tax=Gossypium lobatum TaxID=34289 RepID=A0A7J8LUM7_9ROSI|nr:hypothetical protein [Gossypium lobatum]
MYERKILLEVGEMIRKVEKIDMNTNNRVRWCFARVVVCGRYGHVNEACLNRVFRPSVETETLPSGSSPMDLVMANEGTRGRCELYGPWMLLERNSRQKSREFWAMGVENSVKKVEGSQFHALIFLNKDMGDSSDEYKILGNNNIKGKKILVGGPQGTAFNSHNLGLIERGGSKRSS